MPVASSPPCANGFRGAIDHAVTLRKLDALRNEVKAARILGASSPLGFEFARKQWEDAKQVTDTLNALEDEQ